MESTFVVRSGDGEIADTCDECGAGIPYRATCYMVRKGETEDGLPVVSVVCAECHD